MQKTMVAIFCDGKFIQALDEKKDLKCVLTNKRFEVVKVEVKDDLAHDDEIEVKTKTDIHTIYGSAFGAKAPVVEQLPIQLAKNIIALPRI